ncbi:S-layer homology domain-containing protein [Paenibacillus sp. 2TAB19]|uniref:S-layer homology domain-containing protein n=1 Tax=Paenibacillus sp. 2TAB19 TaxID=3233003 RepID=UPI003F943D47
MTSRIIQVMLVMMMLLLALLPGTAFAADKPSFSISVSLSTPKVGDEFSVVVHGNDLQDLFGYEMNMAYSSDILQFISATSSLGNGFAIDPIVKGGIVTYAFSKVGATTAGINGSSDVASLKFKVINMGISNVKLTRVKTVSKSLTASEFKTDVRVSVTGTASTEITFTDVPDEYWAKPDITRAAALGFVYGYPDGTFKPLRKVTRAEYVTMLARALHLSDNTATANSATAFKDADKIGAWAKEYVSKAVDEGWIKGYGDGTFRPNLPVTREEMTVIATRALKFKAAKTGTLTFADSDKIQAWAKPFVIVAVEEGIVKGRANNKFDPSASANRAEAVTMILRIVDHGQQG